MVPKMLATGQLVRELLYSYGLRENNMPVYSSFSPSTWNMDERELRKEQVSSRFAEASTRSEGSAVEFSMPRRSPRISVSGSGSTWWEMRVNIQTMNLNSLIYYLDYWYLKFHAQYRKRWYFKTFVTFRNEALTVTVLIGYIPIEPKLSFTWTLQLSSLPLVRSPTGSRRLDQSGLAPSAMSTSLPLMVWPGIQQRGSW